MAYKEYECHGAVYGIEREMVFTVKARTEEEAYTKAAAIMEKEDGEHYEIWDWKEKS